MKKTMLLLVAILVVGGLAFYFMRGNKSSTTTTSTNENVAEPNTVMISSFTFTPNTLTVKAGTTVTWKNNDAVDHNIKSQTFNSPTIKQGGTYQFTFANKGTYNYSCGIHPSMTGTIVVE